MSSGGLIEFHCNRRDTCYFNSFTIISQDTQVLKQVAKKELKMARWMLEIDRAEKACLTHNDLFLTQSSAFREELEFIANTVVFLLSGIVIAGRIYDSSQGHLKLIEARDWGYTLLLWVYLTVSFQPQHNNAASTHLSRTLVFISSSSCCVSILWKPSRLSCPHIVFWLDIQEMAEQKGLGL